ncbi:hypothetical protein VPH35_125445 [Triticum aestivum]
MMPACMLPQPLKVGIAGPNKQKDALQKHFCLQKRKLKNATANKQHSCSRDSELWWPETRSSEELDYLLARCKIISVVLKSKINVACMLSEIRVWFFFTISMSKRETKHESNITISMSKRETKHESNMTISMSKRETKHEPKRFFIQDSA